MPRGRKNIPLVELEKQGRKFRKWMDAGRSLKQAQSPWPKYKKMLTAYEGMAREEGNAAAARNIRDAKRLYAALRTGQPLSRAAAELGIPERDAHRLIKAFGVPRATPEGRAWRKARASARKAEMDGAKEKSGLAAIIDKMKSHGMDTKKIELLADEIMEKRAEFLDMDPESKRYREKMQALSEEYGDKLREALLEAEKSAIRGEKAVINVRKSIRVVKDMEEKKGDY